MVFGTLRFQCRIYSEGVCVLSNDYEELRTYFIGHKNQIDTLHEHLFLSRCEDWSEPLLIPEVDFLESTTIFDLRLCQQY